MYKYMYLNDSVRFCTFLLSAKVSKTRHIKHLPFLTVPRIKQTGFMVNAEGKIKCRAGLSEGL